MSIRTAVTGFARIGEKRELKRAVESFWKGEIDMAQLNETAAALRRKHWELQREQGIELIPSNDFSLYDNMLDTTVMLGAIPDRFRDIDDPGDLYFALARGRGDCEALEMTKWFNTNYHYIVPEIEDDTRFALDCGKILKECEEAKALGIKTKINLIGPITFLSLSKSRRGGDPLARLNDAVEVYRELLERIAELDEEVYVQLDEPIFVCDPDEELLRSLKQVYSLLPTVSPRIKLIFATYFEHACEAVQVLSETWVWGVALDFVHGPRNIDAVSALKGKQLIAGVIDGRNVWVAELKRGLALLNEIAQMVPRENITVATSCSLLHVPYSVANEPDSPVKPLLAFGCEKVAEVVLLDRIFRGDIDGAEADSILIANRELIGSRLGSGADAPSERHVRAGSFVERIAAQKERLDLPPLPTTTIGSFPQTLKLRKLRRALKNGDIPKDDYENGIRQYIRDCVAFQEKIGLDVLVHGEPERNDMVEYFGEMLEGFHFTSNGWVQSYGSRCVKPPIIYGDIARVDRMTVDWISFAQSLTDRVMKGMLTGPVTILNWSFVRTDIPRAQVSFQIANALRGEIDDLQRAGIRIIQVDEAAFKEGYPLRHDRVADYEDWSLASFKTAVSSAWIATQIHTHMCYSDFNDIIDTIEDMDADVITIETARSGNELLQVFKRTGYANEIGPGVYDIHSPRVPDAEEFEDQIRHRLEVLEPSKMWVNPDCGLKTRKWEEVEPALANMVAATVKVRAELS